ncbi:MAG: fluoride efflux transporter CrcB [Melioribacteraceae bacterium]|nr:fluoride efflux transporter CrcB [Melioribacteraceae bacterium]MCF8264357.1 fluoride efflux transporter CrcB [Melioribacteraceae bacterium]MCF8413414.1 fluoride efflux transporter CrcB [Melioribacteraceae bacterium]
MMNYILVFLGAGIGGTLRYFISTFLQKNISVVMPFGTLLVNFLGSFILGFLIFGLDEKQLVSQKMKIFLGIGFCGGLTTFSTFSLETINLFRDYEFLLASINVIANVILSLSAIYLSYIITR